MKMDNQQEILENKNLIATDNRLSNLEIVSHKENVKMVQSKE